MGSDGQGKRQRIPGGPRSMTVCSISQPDSGTPPIMAAPDSMSLELALEIKQEILAILDEILSLNGRGASFTEKTPLLGAIPELDSMAVVAMITTLEERFGFSIEDDEIDGATFATLGSLIDFVQWKIAA